MWEVNKKNRSKKKQAPKDRSHTEICRTFVTPWVLSDFLTGAAADFGNA